MMSFARGVGLAAALGAFVLGAFLVWQASPERPRASEAVQAGCRADRAAARHREATGERLTAADLYALRFACGDDQRLTWDRDTALLAALAGGAGVVLLLLTAILGEVARRREPDPSPPDAESERRTQPIRRPGGRHS